MPIVVVDNGTAYTKCGFGGENFPTSVFHTMVGRPIVRSGAEVDSLSLELKDIMVGNEAAEARAALEVNYPFKCGVVKDWDDMNLIWNHTFNDVLKVDPKESKLMLTEPPQNSKSHREKLCQVMFEDFGFGHLFIGLQAVLVLYAQGLMDGLVVDSGDSVTHAVPVIEGTILSHSVKRMNLGGCDITEYLIKLLLRRGYVFNKTADFDTVRQLKEMFCYVACDMELEKKLAYDTCVLETKHQLPDKTWVRLGTERFEAPNILFKPHLVDKEGNGLTELVYGAVQDSSIDVRTKLYEHTVLSGGTTMFPGLPTRIENELKQKHLDNALKGDTSRMGRFKLHIEDPPRRKFLVFSGAAVLADLMETTNADAWVSKAEYEECGPKAIWDKTQSC